MSAEKPIFHINFHFFKLVSRENSALLQIQIQLYTGFALIVKILSYCVAQLHCHLTGPAEP